MPLSKITSDLFAGTYSDVTKYLDYSCTGDILTLNDDYKYDSKNKGWVKDVNENIRRQSPLEKGRAA